MTVDGAIHAVKAFIKVTGSIKEIEIRQVPNHEKQWHYLIKVDDKAMKYKYSIYVALMNGALCAMSVGEKNYTLIKEEAYERNTT